MKKSLLFIGICFFTSIILITFYNYKTEQKINNIVAFNGSLQVKNGHIENKYGDAVQLKGVSSNGIQWDLEDNIINYDNLKVLKEDWKINTFRIAMYTEEDGYISNKEKVKNKVINVIDDCIKLNLYVIVDWHILSDNDPNIHVNESVEFFSEISNRYKNQKNLIYEICNEPNGDDVRWKSSIYPYATKVIGEIRKNAPDSLIIVGTPDWSKNILEVIGEQLPYKNILYSFHFYAGTQQEPYRESLMYAIEKDLPVFVSEWGTSTAEGGIGFFEEEANKWLELLNKNNISWINWSLSNKNESTSILKEHTTKITDENLTQAGFYVKELMKSDN